MPSWYGSSRARAPLPQRSPILPGPPRPVRWISDVPSRSLNMHGPWYQQGFSTGCPEGTAGRGTNRPHIGRMPVNERSAEADRCRVDTTALAASTRCGTTVPARHRRVSAWPTRRRSRTCTPWSCSGRRAENPPAVVPDGAFSRRRPAETVLREKRDKDVEQGVRPVERNNVAAVFDEMPGDVVGDRFELAVKAVDHRPGAPAARSRVG